jgi:hypothetical protein
MYKGLKYLLIVSAGAASLCAQESYIPTLGFKVGVPVTDMLSAKNTSEFGDTINGSPFSAAVPRYEFGVSAEFHITSRLRFEVDGIYKRGGFNSALPFGSSGGLAYRPTSFNNWEIPGLFKTNVSVGHLRPFIDFGAALRHISTISQYTYAPGLVIPEFTDNSIALHNRNSFGGVAGIGFTFKKGPFELSPEVRYTRWANQAFQYPGLRTNLDQGDVLLGIGF